MTEILTVCCQCGSTKDWHGDYNDNIVLTREMQKDIPYGKLSHGLCNPCLDKCYNEMEDIQNDCIEGGAV